MLSIGALAFLIIVGIVILGLGYDLLRPKTQKPVANTTAPSANSTGGSGNDSGHAL